jgi:hypothetical protein
MPPAALEFTEGAAVYLMAQKIVLWLTRLLFEQERPKGTKLVLRGI